MLHRRSACSGATLIAEVDAMTPVRVRLITSGVPLALLVIEMLPEAAPTVIG